MVSINRNHFNNIESLKKIDSNSDNKITFGELKKISEKDGQKGLSKEDLSSIGINDELVQQEVLTRYSKAEANIDILDDTKIFDIDDLLKNACKNILDEMTNSGGIRIILNKVLDKDNDSKLSISELKNLTPEEKSEIQDLIKKYSLDSSRVETLFKSLEIIKENYPNSSDEEIIKSLYGDDTKKDKTSIISNSIDISATKFSESAMSRALLNAVLEKDFDGKISFGELKELFENPSKLEDLKNMAKNNLVGEGTINSLINNLKPFYDLNKDKITDDNTIVIKENDWKSNWIMIDKGEDQIEINKAKNDPVPIENLKNNLIEKSSNNEKIKQLVDNLGNNLTKEHIHYISKLLDKNSIDKISNICNKLNDYFNSEITDKSLVKPEQKIEFINQVLHDITYPNDIDQKSKGTCAATAVQMKLAVTDPERYIDISTKLAKGENYEMSENKIIRPNNTFLDDKFDTRTISCKIMQNAFMDYTRNHDMNIYHDKNQIITSKFNSRFSGDAAQAIGTASSSVFGEKVDYNKEQKDLGAGVVSKDRDKLEDDLFGEGDLITKNKDNINDLAKEIDDDLSKGIPVTMAVSGHAITLISKNTESNPPKYNLFSWGKTFEMTEEKLKQFIVSAITSK